MRAVKNFYGRLSIQKIKKIIIHHTATSKIDDPEASVRAIYYYHAVSRGWGDIGYNYIVDQNGKVYEGRYGGDGVVADTLMAITQVQLELHFSEIFKPAKYRLL